MSLDETVRQGDRTAYLAALFAPPEARGALIALAAYRLELARVVAMGVEPMAAEIRLQWWRDAIRNEGFGEGASVPLVTALREAAARYRWPIDTLCGVSEGYIHDLYADPFADRDAFDGYAGETRGALVQLAAMALGVEALGEAEGLAAARTAAVAAGYAGVALVAAEAALAVVPELTRGRSMIPADAFEDAAGAPLSAVLPEGGATLPDAAKTAAVRALIDHGFAAEQEMRRHLGGVAAEVRAAFLPALTARLSLERAARRPLAPRPPGALALQLALWRAARRL
ncbi:squalene/phytoene synthase family protein [Acuticoccus mangrovi]|uniref:Squalene/phytoene synthase family protein n=1 Tax=Acuticoccus mangrovi TaxID=2796142 RepID=A0A934MGF7_9HYPH|nr:squalene/phytoene synthase family protein [Acuticoccus mangrovi]MBJ3776533.1 squalene/phytoene synthase family protein [Acuticoccus mangrovi]